MDEEKIINIPTSSISSKIQQKQEVVPYISDLPENYGDTKIVLLPRDPWWCFSYWEIGENTKKEIRQLYGENIQYLLRVYDITNVEKFDGKNANKYFDILISPQANNWYINLPEPNRSWCVDLGFKTSEGKFIVIARSNTVLMPRFGVSPISDEQWVVLQKEFERLLELSGVEMVGKGSFDIARLMRERWEELIAISQIPQFISSGFVSSFVKQQQEVLPKEFFLKADTELIVYGQTMPDATLYINQKEFKLTPDGMFSLRVALPDGEKVLSIKAVSKDKTEEREIVFNVKRSTKTG